MAKDEISVTKSPLRGMNGSGQTALEYVFRNGESSTREELTPESKRYLETVLPRPYPWEAGYRENIFYFKLKLTMADGSIVMQACDYTCKIDPSDDVLPVEKQDVVHVDIPSGVTVIGEGAFQDYGSLASVTIPAGVTEIGSSAFEDCVSLESITSRRG